MNRFLKMYNVQLYRPLGAQLVRQLHTTRVLKINPLLPIDPGELLSNMENEEKTLQEEEKKRIRGRIRDILKKPRITIQGNEEVDNKKEVKKNANDANDSNVTYGRNSGGNGNSNNSGNGNGGGSGSGNSNGNDNEKSSKKKKKKDRQNNIWKQFMSLAKRCMETGIITLASLGVLVLGGIIYHKIYKKNVLWKMDDSFHTDESLLLVKHRDNADGVDKEFWAETKHQPLIDAIITGKIKGKYYLLLGEKGTGKTSTVMESINRVDGEDCAIVDCSSDVELMRLRIGSALNFEFFEDYIGSLFSMKGPRESTPILDIERAFMKLEKILIDRKKRTNKPLILVFNNSHLIDTSLVELLQQKAENFSSSGMMTMLFISDDYWLFEKFKTFSTRIQVINFEDTKLKEACKILKSSRIKYFDEQLKDDECETIYNLIGGRPQHLNHVASNRNMLKAAHILIDNEKLWFLNKCALLGADMDDDVMESGKFATSAMLLMRELVEIDRVRKEKSNSMDIIDAANLPQLPLWRARQVMTRPDYIEKYDELNLFTIGTDSNVKADSVPMMRAFHEIASHPGFDDLLRETIDRISEIESLGRTRELVFKDLALGGHYRIYDEKEDRCKIITVEGGTKDDDNVKEESDKGDKLFTMDHDYHEGERKKWWKRRLVGYSNPKQK